MRFLVIVGIIWHVCLADVHIHNDFASIKSPIKSWINLRDANLTKQRYDYSCGSASLSTILTYYYGENISEKDILDFLLIAKGIDIDKKEELETDKTLRDSVSFSFTDLATFAESKGFRTKGLALDLPSLSQLKIPVIIYVNVRDMEHFTVYKGIDSQFVYLADPSFGNIKVKISKFKEMFYQREDLTYPGKILAILPKHENTPKKQDFLHIPPSILIYESIKQKIR